MIIFKAELGRSISEGKRKKKEGKNDKLIEKRRERKREKREKREKEIWKKQRKERRERKKDIITIRSNATSSGFKEFLIFFSKQIFLEEERDDVLNCAK